MSSFLKRSNNDAKGNIVRLMLVVAVFVSVLLVLHEPVSAKKQEHVNPSHSDVEQEKIRLRTEGIAHFESGIGQKKALALFQKVLAMNEKSGLDHYNVAIAYKKMNNIAKAKEHLHKAVKLDSNMAHPYYVLGLIYISENKNKEALKVFSKAAELMPNAASAHYQISRMHRELGDSKSALQEIVETLRLDPYHTGAMYQLYLFHQQGGDKEKANQIFLEFSRLKKAIGQTRKEVNPDESELAIPLSGELASLKKPFTAALSEPKFSVTKLKKVKSVNSYSVADLNEDKIQDLAILSEKGELSLWINDPKAGFKLKGKGSAVGNALDMQLAKLKRGSPYSVIVASESGLSMLPLINPAAPKKSVKAGHGSVPTEPTLIKKLKIGEIQQLSNNKVNYIGLADVDHDGDTDIISDGFASVWLNRGDAKFDEKANYLKLDNNQLQNISKPLLSSDLRNLIAVDFIAIDKDDKHWILRDEMGGKYKLFDRLEKKKSLLWSGRADMDNDGWTDIVSLTASGLEVDYNNGELNFDSKLSSSNLSSIKDAIIADFNNDGFKDIVMALPGGGIQVWSNIGSRKFNLSEKILPEVKLRKLSILDSNGDGRLDIAGIGPSGDFLLLANETETDNAKWLSLKLDGIRSAPDGRYTQVEVRYGGFYSKYEADGDIVHVPLGQASHAETLRISWPNGFVENKFKIDAEETWFFAESERISGSCPSVYAWNGERYVYITDAFISGPMGVPVAPGKYFPVDDDEYVKIPGQHLVADDDGNYRVTIVEELREVTYLDQVRLYAVDYPADHHMFPNEYLKPPEFPEFELHISGSAKAPLKAVDHHGNDVSRLVQKVDYKYPHNFNRLDYTGFADEHGIEFDLPKETLHGDHLRLFLTGWFYYFDSTSLISASQQPEVEMVWPQVQMLRDGEWTTLKRFGIPSGKEKTVVVDLSGAVPADAEKLRIWTNVELYWDQVLVDTEAPPRKDIASLTELTSVKSRLRFHGFSELIRPVGEFPMPDRFDYHRASYQSLWNPLRGRYTRYGEVDQLINTVDSKLAVFGSGDELAMTFSGKDLPPLKPGYQRDFLIYLNGFVKDGDKYTAHAGDVEPMPYAGLAAYPDTAKDRKAAGLDSKEYQQYLRDYQSRQPLQFTGPDA